jgi:hypothetical protein
MSIDFINSESFLVSGFGGFEKHRFGDNDINIQYQEDENENEEELSMFNRIPRFYSGIL